jgi:heat shock protein HslJ
VSLPHRALRLIAILAIAVAVAGCTSDTQSSSPTPGGTLAGLAGTSWIVVTVNGRSPVTGAVPTLAFAGERIQAFFGCNQGGGVYRFDRASGEFAVQDMAITQMACAGVGVSTSESALAQALSSVNRATLDSTGQLLLDGAGGRIVLVTLVHPAAP